MDRVYMCVDLKSFYASVECVERNLDPLNTNLVVADESRTSKTICLAVSPPLKEYGISGRARLFEVIKKVNEINLEREKKINQKINRKSYYDNELKNNSNLKVDFIIAPPRMAKYIKYSSKIYSIYLKYLSKDDVFAYSIDEVFCDITNYLKYYDMSAKQLATKIVHDIYNTTGITATVGIGTNLYLAKIAMDILAKHTLPDNNGVRISELNEYSYRKLLWNHKPLCDFWRIGSGIMRRLENNKMYTMGDIAVCSINNSKLLYKLFGVNAELLIDHAWGYEPCTIKSVKLYKPKTNSLSSSQVLHTPYEYSKAKIIVKEMTDNLVLHLVEKKYMTNLITLNIIYDVENLTNKNIKIKYHGEIVTDHYGRYIPKPVHGCKRFDHHISSTKLILKNMIDLFDLIVNKNLVIRKIGICFCNLIDENKVKNEAIYKQFELFTDVEEDDKKTIKELTDQKYEKNLQLAIIDIKNKYGKNSILKALDLEDGATTIQRNFEIGGHMG